MLVLGLWNGYTSVQKESELKSHLLMFNMHDIIVKFLMFVLLISICLLFCRPEIKPKFKKLIMQNFLFPMSPNSKIFNFIFLPPPQNFSGLEDRKYLQIVTFLPFPARSKMVFFSLNTEIVKINAEIVILPPLKL